MENEKTFQGESGKKEPLRGIPGLRNHLEGFLPSMIPDNEKERMLEFLSRPEFSALHSSDTLRNLKEEEFNTLINQMNKEALDQGNIKFFPIQTNIQRMWGQMHGKRS